MIEPSEMPAADKVNVSATGALTSQTTFVTLIEESNANAASAALLSSLTS